MPGFDRAGHVHGVDHQHIPVTRLRLFKDGKARCGAFVFLQVHLDAELFLERLDQRGIGVVAPHQRVQFLRKSGGGGQEKGKGGQAAGHLHLHGAGDSKRVEKSRRI